MHCRLSSPSSRQSYRCLDATVAVSVSIFSAFPVQCAPGFEPTVPKPRSDADCRELRCSPGLVVSPERTSCIGCAPGSYGTPPSCAACNASLGEMCPGFTLRPLLSPSFVMEELLRSLRSLQSRIPGAGGSRLLTDASDSSACEAAAALSQLPIVAAKAPPLTSSTRASQITVGVLSLIFFLIVAATFVFAEAPSLIPGRRGSRNSGTQSQLAAAAAAAAALSRSGSLGPAPGSAQEANAPSWGSKLLRRVDAFGMNHQIKEGTSPVKRSTALGGAFSIAAMVALLAIWSIIVLQREENNVIESSTVDGLSEDALQSAARLPAAAVGGFSGLYFVVSAVGDGSKCLNASTATTGLFSGSATVSSSMCGAVAQHVISCPTCVVGPESKIRLDMDFSCQGFLVQAYSVAPGPIASVRTLTYPQEIPGVPITGLLNTLTWEVPPMLTILEDPHLTQSETRGYRLLQGAYSAATTAITGDSIKPAQAAVTVILDVSPPALYAQTTRSERVSAAQLLGALAGFMGVVTLFGRAFMLAELSPYLYRRAKTALSATCGRFCCCCCSSGGSSASNGAAGSGGGLKKLVSTCCERRRPKIVATTAPKAGAGSLGSVSVGSLGSISASGSSSFRLDLVNVAATPRSGGATPSSGPQRLPMSQHSLLSGSSSGGATPSGASSTAAAGEAAGASGVGTPDKGSSARDGSAAASPAITPLARSHASAPPRASLSIERPAAAAADRSRDRDRDRDSGSVSGPTSGVGPNSRTSDRRETTSMNQDPDAEAAKSVDTDPEVALAMPGAVPMATVPGVGRTSAAGTALGVASGRVIGALPTAAPRRGSHAQQATSNPSGGTSANGSWVA